jgi:hypothetical protein
MSKQVIVTKKILNPKKKNVVVKTTQVKSKGKKQTAQRPRMSKYALSLLNPFDENATGVRVPDEYCFPSDVRRIIGRYTLKADTSGNFDFVAFPHPVFSSYSSVSGVVASSPLPNAGSTVYVGGLISQANMALNFGSYRVVSWGIRVRNLVPPVNVTGSVIFAQIPLGNTLPMSAFKASQITNATSFVNYMNLPPLSGSYITPEIENLSCAQLLTLEEIAQDRSVVIPGKICGPEAFTFRPTYRQGTINSTYSEGDDILVNTTLNQIQDGYIDATAEGLVNGQSCIMITGFGLPNVNCIEVEVVYHLEAIIEVAATISSSGQSNFSSAQIEPYQPQLFNQALEMMSRAPWIQIGDMLTGGKVSGINSVINKAKATYGNLVSNMYN